MKKCLIAEYVGVWGFSGKKEQLQVQEKAKQLFATMVCLLLLYHTNNVQASKYTIETISDDDDDDDDDDDHDNDNGLTGDSKAKRSREKKNRDKRHDEDGGGDDMV